MWNFLEFLSINLKTIKTRLQCCNMRFGIGKQEEMKWLWVGNAEIYFRLKLWKFEWVKREPILCITFPCIYIRYHLY